MSYVFYCDERTKEESLSEGVFGNTYHHWESVKEITPGTPIFLINLDTGTLRGPFKASNKPRLYLDPYAFINSGRNYPAQIQVTWQKVMKINNVFNKLKFLRKDIRCRLNALETVQILMLLVEEHNNKIRAWV